jgi:hypothetical protein
MKGENNMSHVVSSEGGHDKEINDFWNESECNPILAELTAGKDLQKIIESIPNIQEAFKKNPDCCGCSDGRIHEHRFARAGQGILVGVESVVNWIGEEIEKGAIKDKFEFTSHTGCGAAKIVCNQLQKEGKLPQNFNADQLGIQFSKDVIEAASIKFPQIEFIYRHIEAHEMDKIHNERCIYLDATQKINPKVISELPSGFIMTVMPEVNLEITKSELTALCGIALGDHGFGKRFTSEKPFWIIVSAKNEEEENSQIELAKSVVNQFEEGRVKVAGFVVPNLF